MFCVYSMKFSSTLRAATKSPGSDKAPRRKSMVTRTSNDSNGCFYFSAKLCCL